MSMAPESLKAIRHKIRELTGDTWIVSIRANLRPGDKYEGYHAGYADIDGPLGVGTAKAYSTIRPRDRKNRNLKHIPPLASANASSATDITVRGMGRGQNAKEQRRFTAWLVERAKVKLLDVQFIVGPNAEGEGTIWMKPDWKPKPGVDKTHTHISWPRDTEFGDRVSQLTPYWES